MTSKPSYKALANVAESWHQNHSRSFPWRDSRDPYAVLIGEVLLQRTRGDLVAPVFVEFIKRWPTADRLGRAREETISRVIKPLGLAKRAPLIKRLGRQLSLTDSVPTKPEDLLRLPGVGPYAAHAVPVFALGEEYPVVDWVIARVIRRYFGLELDRRPNQDSDLWLRAARLLDHVAARPLWLGLLDFASEICKPNPQCEICPLNKSCCTGRERLESRAPN